MTKWPTRSVSGRKIKNNKKNYKKILQYIIIKVVAGKHHPSLFTLIHCLMKNKTKLNSTNPKTTKTAATITITT